MLNSTATFDLEPETIASRLAWFTKHQEDGLPVMVMANQDEQVLGFASLSFYHLRPAYKATFEPSVYIANDYLAYGFGKLLTNELLHQASLLKAHCLVGLICSENEPSLRLVESLGFNRVGLLREVGEKFGRRLDVTLVQLIL